MRCVMFDSVAASVPSTGVVYNYLESTLVQKGFVKCYDQPYSHYTSSANLNACADLNLSLLEPRAHQMLMFFSIGAFGASVNVFKNTYSTYRAYYDAASLPTCGIQYDYKESDLIQKGYVKCYEQPYSHATSSVSLATCSGSEYVFVGAKTSKGASSFAIGAFGVTSNVFKYTFEQKKAVLDAGGAYWYRYPGWSFGFASSSTVNLNSCDYNNPDCASRMCWHLDQNAGGYRAGCTVG
eukprot:Em0002g1201a